MWFWLLSCPYVAMWNPSPATSASVCLLLPPSSCRGWPGKNVVSRLKPVVLPSEPMPPNPHYAHTCRSLLSLGSRFTRCGSSNGLTRLRPWPSRPLFSMRLGRRSAENLVAVADTQVFHRSFDEWLAACPPTKTSATKRNVLRRPMLNPPVPETSESCPRERR